MATKNEQLNDWLHDNGIHPELIEIYEGVTFGTLDLSFIKSPEWYQAVMDFLNKMPHTHLQPYWNTAVVEWTEILSTNGSEVGWHTTGDTISTAIVDGNRVWQRTYGNTTAFYMPQEMLEKVYENAWQQRLLDWGLDKLVYNALAYWDAETIGSDLYKWRVEMHGIQHFIDMVKAQNYVTKRNSASVAVKEKYAPLGYNILLLDNWYDASEKAYNYKADDDSHWRFDFTAKEFIRYEVK